MKINITKKSKLLLLIMICLLFFGLFFINRQEVVAASTLTKLPKTQGNGYVTYGRQEEEILIPSEYEATTKEFRGVWVSPFAGDIPGYNGRPEAFKQELLEVLDTMQSLNMNALLFHLRTHNDALYNTQLAPQSSYVRGMDYDSWDYLEWLIDECHNRGMEFHAWLNPYRISSSATTMAAVQSKYADFPNNPAHNSENVLIGTSGAILDPGRPAVRTYVREVCMELARNYDIDAIHFDDYFYISGVNDDATFNKYKNQYNTSLKSDFRRLQVDQFIKELSEDLDKYNRETGNYVQLGVSPSGMYQNGSYVPLSDYKYDANGTLTYPLFSNTRGFAHYGDYLYSDTKKWIDNEWIDYILPQMYFSFEKEEAPYADLADWWSAVVKNKKVNLYTGLGFYKIGEAGDIGWQSNPYELTNELLYNTKKEEIKGACIYQYRTIKNQINCAAVQRLKNEYWNMPAIGPELRRSTQMESQEVSTFEIIKGTKVYNLGWGTSISARKYAIYRSETTIDENDPKQLIAIVSSTKHNDKVYYTDLTSDVNKTYQYRIVAVSQSNDLSSGVTLSTTSAVATPNIPFGTFNGIFADAKAKINGKFNIVISPMNVQIGTTPSYDVYISFDKVNWEKVTKEPLDGSESVRCPVQFSSDGRPMYVKVEAKNDIGTVTSNIVTITLDTVNATEFMEEIMNNIINKFNDIL